MMGFSENRSKRALMETGNNVENALNMIMSTLDDLSLDAPIQSKKKAMYIKFIEEILPMKPR